MSEVCRFCDVGGRYLSSPYCERCFRELNHLPPVYRKLAERTCADIVTRILVEEGLDPQVNVRIPELNIYPDLMVRIGPLMVIIEIDENQHKRQIDKDELRTAKLKKQYSPLLVLRINPDSYRGSPKMITMSTELCGTIVRRTVCYNTGEIELRQKTIRRTLLNLISQTQTDLLLGVKLPVFREVLLFFDIS